MQLPLNFDVRTPAPKARTRAIAPQIASAAPLAPVAPILPRLSEPPVVFVRHPRARRYLIRVTQDGTVRVTVPRWGSKREAERFAEREHGWIEAQLRRVELDRERRAADASAEPVLSNTEQRALRARATRELPARLLELAARFGLTVSRISIRNQRWRWGSCSRSGLICLNWRLVTMPDSVRDYVLIHELMHLRRLDHSPKFWKLVADACPEYEEARAWLRNQGAR
ncbi:MAG TPA: SprT family zinc-dependent metalloprotease [Vicinamibacterales bacterium]